MLRIGCKSKHNIGLIEDEGNFTRYFNMPMF